MHLLADGFYMSLYFFLPLIQARIQTVVPKVKQCISGLLIHGFSTPD